MYRCVKIHDAISKIPCSPDFPWEGLKVTYENGGNGCFIKRLGKEEAMVVTIMVEVPKGGRNKYEYDKEKKRLRFDRMLFSSVHYPSDYGFILDTLAQDGDALDALVLLWEPTFPGCIIEAKPVGLFKMRDEKGQDEKILCVPLYDPLWNLSKDFRRFAAPAQRDRIFWGLSRPGEKKTGVEGWEITGAL